MKTVTIDSKITDHLLLCRLLVNNIHTFNSQIMKVDGLFSALLAYAVVSSCLLGCQASSAGFGYTRFGRSLHRQGMGSRLSRARNGLYPAEQIQALNQKPKSSRQISRYNDDFEKRWWCVIALFYGTAE